MLSATGVITPLTVAACGVIVQDMFLQGPPSVLDPDAEHFVVRPNARVQPLSAGFSYTQATPPPPSLFRGQGESSRRL